MLQTKIVGRVLKEIQEVNEGDDDLRGQIHLQAIDDADVRKLHGYIRGPSDTPYDNGLFKLAITLPTNYPFRPPIVHFLTKIYHPNIKTAGGYICLDVLAQAWSPSMSLKTMLLSLQLLLQDPRPDDPLELTIAQLLKNNREAFNKTAFFWTGEYALSPEERNDEWKRMNAMVSSTAKRRKMGRVKAINTLAREGWVDQRQRRRVRNQSDLAGECEDGPTVASRRRRNSPAPGSSQVDAEEEERDEEGPVAPTRRRNNTTARTTQEDEESEEESDTEVGEMPPEVLRMIARALARRGMDTAGESDDEDDNE